MKKTALLFKGFFAITLFIVLTGCSKENNASEEGQKSHKLTELVPQAYLDGAKDMGFEIYTGDNPPDVVGEYLLAPWRFDGDNYSTMVSGAIHADGFTLRLSEQKGTSLGVRYIGYYEGTKELGEPFIVGSGNNFTIGRHILMVGGSGANFSFPYVQLISGTKDGEVLRNIQMATIGLRAETPNQAGITVEGEISVRSDADGVSNRKNQ